MNSLKVLYEIRLFDDRRHLPPPSVNPATPTPGRRPPMTFTPVWSSALYTSPQVRPAPTSTVPRVGSTFVWLKRVIALCTPLVEENPGFAACPPPFTAKGVRLDPRIRIYEMRVSKCCCIRSEYFTILLSSSAEPGSTEQVDSSEAEGAECELSRTYWDEA